ncbi:hypothetical protein GCM10022378_09360 [Salinicoccus jeotgali]|uniref:DZANK-type domain-containing protein n=1 Tax=Salinicoccus jeotgali TaxID=381634 RepID=A0ABP7EMC5_9STAP
MQLKVKRCTHCQTIVSDSLNACPKCGSASLEEGTYLINGQHKSFIITPRSTSKVISCPTCGAGVNMRQGGECRACGDEISGAGGSLYEGYMDFD